MMTTRRRLRAADDTSATPRAPQATADALAAPPAAPDHPDTRVANRRDTADDTDVSDEAAGNAYGFGLNLAQTPL